MITEKINASGLGTSDMPGGRAYGEARQPLAHVAPDSLKNRILFGLRLVFDMEVSTTYRDVRKRLKQAGANALEVGCGASPYRRLIPETAKYHALDWKGAGEHFHYKNNRAVYYDGGTFPLRDGAFNLVFHTEVLEHIYDLKRFLSECNRVLAKGGEMFFTVPFAARYHYIPDDYWRLTPAALERVLAEANFKGIRISPRGNDLAVAAWKANAVFYRLILRGRTSVLARTANILFFGTIFALPVLCLTLIGHAAIWLGLGSVDDPLGYTVYCGK